MTVVNACKSGRLLYRPHFEVLGRFTVRTRNVNGAREWWRCRLAHTNCRKEERRAETEESHEGNTSDFAASIAAQAFRPSDAWLLRLTDSDLELTGKKPADGKHVA